MVRYIKEIFVYCYVENRRQKTMQKTGKTLVKLLLCIFFCSVFLNIQGFAENTEADFEAIAQLPKFDRREHGIITPVKDQGASNLCWAYSVIAASEASLVLNGIAPQNVSLSPEALGYIRQNRGQDPLGNTSGEITSASGNWYTASGNCFDAVNVLSQWCGPVSVTDKDINMTNIYDKTAYRMESAVCLNNANDRNAVKRIIAEYGAITFSYNNMRECEFYNPTKETGSSAYPHACTIIGWDDTIPAEKFSPGGAKQDGGWLIKNSYSSLPYFYLSYDCGGSNLVAFKYAPREKYDYNYFYDAAASDFGLTIPHDDHAANIFEAKKGTDSACEYIKAVNVAVKGYGTTCKISVYTDLEQKQDMQDSSNINPEKGNFAAEQTEYFDYPGYYTIELDEPVEVQNGSYFSAIAEVSNSSGNAALRFVLGSKLTYLYGDYWMKSRYTARIKAFTSVEEIAEPSAAPTAEPTAIPSLMPTAEPTAEPSPTPTAEPKATLSPTPTVEPTATPTAAPKLNDRVEFEKLQNGEVLANIIFEQTTPAKQEDIVFYVAYYKDSRLMRVETPELTNMSSLFEIYEPLADCEIRALVWDKNMKPLMYAQKMK